MSTLISDEYRELNIDAHRRFPGYGSKGHRWSERIVLLARELGAVTILDYGCGKGSLRRVLAELAPDIDVREYDPAVPGKDEPPEAADLVVCTDVLEHVEPDRLLLVIKDLERLTVRAALVAVACRPGKRLLADGSLDHRIVEEPEWWDQRMRSRGWGEVPARRSREYAAVYRRV